MVDLNLAIRAMQQGAVPTAVVAQALRATRPTPDSVLAAAKTMLLSMRPTVIERTTGTLVYPDGKTPCPAGQWADDIGAGKTTELDPNNCLMSGGPWVCPIVVRNIDCANAGRDLVWGDLIPKAQQQLLLLSYYPPSQSASASMKLEYVETVMELCDVVLQGMNLTPYEISSWGTWAIGLSDVMTSADRARQERLAPSGDAGGFAGLRIFDQIRRSGDSNTSLFERQGFGGRPWWHRGPLAAWDAPGNNWDTLPIFAPPVVEPTFFAKDGFGWAPWISANSRYAKICSGEVAPYAQGFFGTNCGQSYAISTVAMSKENWGQRWAGPGYTVYRYALPARVLDSLKAGALGDRGKAGDALRAAMILDPHELMRLVFEQTTNMAPSDVTKGWSFDRVYKVSKESLPEPARTIDDIREVRVCGAQLYVLRARDWASWVAGLNVASILGEAAIRYLKSVRTVIGKLAVRGIASDIKPSDIEAMIASAEQAASAERMAIIGGAASVFQIMGGLVGTIMQLVATAILGGFLEYLNSSVPPSSRQDYDLLLQPFCLRSPPGNTACSFNPEAEGGAERLRAGFTPRELGGGGALWNIAQGRSPPPAPGALTDSVQARENGLLDLLGGKKSRGLLIGAAIGLAAVGGALLWRRLR
jgi:hypothetical protein